MNKSTKRLFFNVDTSFRRDLHDMDRHPKPFLVQFTTVQWQPYILLLDGRVIPNPEPREREMNHRDTRKRFTAAEIMMMPKTAKPINCANLSPDQIAKKYSDRKRIGKTSKDRKRLAA